MEHIVQNHVSGIFYISNEDPEIVEEINTTSNKTLIKKCVRN